MRYHPSPSPNRAYLASCLRHSAKTLPEGRTSDTLKTLFGIMEGARLVVSNMNPLSEKDFIFAMLI